MMGLTLTPEQCQRLESLLRHMYTLMRASGLPNGGMTQELWAAWYELLPLSRMGMKGDEKR